MGASLPRLVIWGASGHARVVADIVARGGQFEIVGFLDDVSPERAGSPFGPARVLGGGDLLPALRDDGVTHAIVGIGSARARKVLSDKVRQIGLQLATAIHPSAVIASDVEIGPGTVIAAQAVVNPGSRLGTSVIVNTAASVDHDCRIDDFVHLAPGVRLAGDVSVGASTWVGIGSVVIEKRQIGADCMIGAGSVVVRDIPSGTVAYGNPARPRRDHAS